MFLRELENYLFDVRLVRNNYASKFIQQFTRVLNFYSSKKDLQANPIITKQQLADHSDFKRGYWFPSKEKNDRSVKIPLNSRAKFMEKYKDQDKPLPQ